MDNFIIKLYKKFLYSHVSRDEFMEMRHTINKSDNEELSTLLEAEWEESVFFDKLSDKSKESIRENLNFYIENSGRSNRWSKKSIMLVAAVVLPFVIISSIFLSNLFTHEKTGDFVVSVERGNKALVTLPDESKVWMNSNSTMEYNKGEKNTRGVKLIGEAFFKVAKNPQQPFVVTLNNLQVEVLGTSFNAKSKQDADIIEISLIEGSVKLQSDDLSHDYYLKPNEKAVYSQSKKQLQILQTDNELETAWKNNKLKFSTERFADVLSMIEDWYGVTIINECPEIENDLMSGSFKDEKLETALNAIKIQYNIDYLKNNDTIIIVRKQR